MKNYCQLLIVDLQLVSKFSHILSLCIIGIDHILRNKHRNAYCLFLPIAQSFLKRYHSASFFSQTSQTSYQIPYPIKTFNANIVAVLVTTTATTTIDTTTTATATTAITPTITTVTATAITNTILIIQVALLILL